MRQSIWRKGTHQTSRKGRLPRQNREYVDTCSCTWKASPQKPVTLPGIMNFVWKPFHGARKPPEAIRDPKQRPQHTEPTLTHHKDPNTPQHNDVCLKASSQNMQTTTGQQRPDPTLTHTPERSLTPTTMFVWQKFTEHVPTQQWTKLHRPATLPSIMCVLKPPLWACKPPKASRTTNTPTSPQHNDTRPAKEFCWGWLGCPSNMEPNCKDPRILQHNVCLEASQFSQFPQIF